MSKKGWLYTIFFVALALGFYFVLALVIPGFTTPKVVPVSFVRPFSFTTQDGMAFTEKEVAGKVYVAEYFFTTCKTICPVMNNHMREVYNAFRDEDGFLILSHTCDPETDSVPQMKKYADSMKVDTRRWVFLTGRKDSLYNMARVSYTIDDPNNNLKRIEDQFLHTQFWALVDRNGDVRKIYDGIKYSEVKKMIVDAKKLLKE
ncbi:MAG: SCO family protein [Sphingobacteriales bacterium]|nr:SCO family protein [Sphingobacteriales bacterium]